MFLRKKYIDRILKYLKIVNSIFLVGGRQVGKTTLLKSLLEFKFLPYFESFYINFDEVAIGGKITFSTLYEFIVFLEVNYKIDFDKINYFLFDEVKNIKNFNILLKALIDKYPEKKFICTSSGNYIRVNDIVEGLAGRNLQIVVYPLDFKEFLEFKGIKYYVVDSEIVFNSFQNYLLEYISFGGYPKVVLSNFNEKKLVLKSILDSVILKDVKDFLKQEQIIDFVKLISYISKSIGSKFSYEGLANELGIKVYSIKKYLTLLEQIFILSFLNPFYTDKRKEISNKRKLYLLDFGVMNYYTNKFFLKKMYTGKDIEMFVFLQLLYNLEDKNIYFYQTLNETEIDFILEDNSGLIPIEVKTSNKDNIPKIFKSFCERYNNVKYFVKTTKYLFSKRVFDNCIVKFLSFLNIFDI